MSGRGEFDLIARHFAPLARRSPLAFGLSDDAAMIKPRAGHALVVTADAIVEGVHYLPDDPPDQIARKLLRVNLSDLAAKGAVPRAYVLTCAFSRDVDDRWIAAFARGLRQDQQHFGIALLGGDTVSTPGAQTFSATLFGDVPGTGMVRRAGAKPGDLIAVTGTIGDGGLGLTELRKPHDGLTRAQRSFLVGRYRLPQPRTRIGPRLLRVAHAALDVSDGLVQDLGHMAESSGVRIEIEIERVPLSPAAATIARADPAARLRALGAGDDYEIVLAVPKSKLVALRTAARAARTRVTVIGTVQHGEGVIVRAGDGKTVVVEQGGFDHFTR